MRKLPATAVLLMGCTAELPAGEVVQADWLRPVSGVRSPLEVECAAAQGGSGSWDVQVDDYSGMTLLRESGSDRIFLRDSFGVIATGCWWQQPVDSPPQELPEELDCVVGGKQDGRCTGEEELRPGFEFRTPGVLQAADLGALAAVDGVALAAAPGALARLDLTPSSHRLAGEEDERSVRSFLADVPAPGGLEVDALARSAEGLLAWDAAAGELAVLPRADAALGTVEPVVRSAPTGGGVMAAAGLYAAIAVEGEVWVFDGLDGEGRPARDRRHHPVLDEGVRDVAVHPYTGLAWVLGPEGVVGLPRRGDPSWHPTPGAEGLLLARPGGFPTVYAWGNVDGSGVIYRLESEGRAVAQPLDQPLLGAGIGEVFQELALVLDEAQGPPEVLGMLDEAHLQAIPPGTVGLALAAFVETPRDEQTLSMADAQAVAIERDLCTQSPPSGLSPEDWLLCCVHAERAGFAAPQLEWLDARLQPDWPAGPAAVVLGINPSVLAPTRYCEATGEPELAELGRALPETVGPWVLDWIDRGVGAAGVLLHNQPYNEPYAQYSSWLDCPDQLAEDAPSSCWERPYSAEAQLEFYQDLSLAAGLEPWIGEEPDWSLLGGGYEGAAQPDLPSWVEIYPQLDLPDGSSPEDGLYFGLLAMDPRNSGLASKDLSPGSAVERARTVPVGSPVTAWDQGQPSVGLSYRPGITYALPWLYELRASGLLFGDFSATAAQLGQWSTDRFRGEEHAAIMTHADFALQQHYLVSRVLAHVDTLSPRLWYFHLQNLDKIQDMGIHEGWIDCAGDCASDTELDRFMEEVAAWAPAVEWRPHP